MVIALSARGSHYCPIIGLPRVQTVPELPSPATLDRTGLVECCLGVATLCLDRREAMFEILEEAEPYRGDRDLGFAHLIVVYIDKGDLYVARIDNPVYTDENLDLSSVEELVIPIDHVYPKFEEGLTVAECMSLDCYRKRPSFAFVL